MTARNVYRYALLFLIGAASCGMPSADHVHDKRATPERIVTVNGTMTEIVAALGLEKHLVGVDVTSTFPASVAQLPRIGHDRTVRAEGVMSLAPNVVLGTVGDIDESVLRQLERAGIAVVLFERSSSVDGTKELIRAVADTLFVADRAGALAAKIDSESGGIRAMGIAPRVLFIYARGAGTLMVAGEGTPMQRMIELAGGRNAVKGFEQFRPLTPEALIAADPDAILLFESGLEALQGEEGLLQVPGLAQTTAGRNRSFIAMDGGLLSNFGPRCGQALARLNEAFRSLPVRP